MKPTETRKLHMLRASILSLMATGLILLTLLPSGCGSGSGKSASSSPAGDSRSGELRISLPPLPESQSRFVPQNAPFIKVEILDAAGADSKVLTPVALFEDRVGAPGVPVQPDAPTGVVPAGDILFDVLDRAKRTTRTYRYLPLKNLILRVGAYRENPYAKPNVTQNPALAKAEVSFVPVRKNLDGTGAQSIDLTLATAIQSLEINGPDVAEADDVLKPFSPYTVNARLDNAIVLVSSDAALKPEKLDWKTEIIQNSIQESGAAVFTTSSSATPQTLNGPNTPDVTQGWTATLVNNSRVERRLRITVTDQETGKQAVKEVRLTPRPSGINLSLEEPPFGTRSVRFIFTPREIGGAPLRIVVPFTELTKIDITKTLQLVPGKYQVTARPFATDDAVTGTELTTDEITVYSDSAPWDALPGYFNHVPGNSIPVVFAGASSNQLVLYVVSGQKYSNASSSAPGNGPGLVPITVQTQITDPALGLVAGQRDYQLEIQVNGIALGNAGFHIVPPSSDAVVEPISGGANTRFRLRLNDQTSDLSGQPFSLREAERKRLEGYTNPTFKATIQANLGGKQPVLVQ